MSVLQVIGIYVVIPGVIVAIIAVMTVGLGHHRGKVHYQPGQPWEHPDQLWGGEIPVIAAPSEDRVGTRIGGARGTW